MNKVNNFTTKNKIPAGIFEGTEAFFYNNEKWLIHQGSAMKFEDATLKVRNIIVGSFMKDKASRDYLQKIGITGFNKGLDMWYKCAVGALDSTPDFVNGKLTADAYNHSCDDYECQHRGKFCSLATGLKNYQVKSLIALKRGKTIEETAEFLCVSVPGLKSRNEKIREKLNVTNMASMMARAGEIGI